NPAVAQCRHDLAEIQHNLALVMRRRGRFDESERLLSESRAHSEKVVAEATDVPVYRRSLALSYQELGMLRYHQHRNREADEVWRKGLELMAALAKDWDTVPLHREELARAYY